ncbi:MAG: IS3 family transposase, partial [Nitrospira sp.]
MAEGTRRRDTETLKQEAVRLVRESARECASCCEPCPPGGYQGIHRESRETYGSPSIWDALIKQGHRVGEHRVARLMRTEGIRAKTVKKWRATTQSNHQLPVATNGLDRRLMIDRPDRVSAGDISYVWPAEGWLCLAVGLDLYAHAVIG